MCGRFTKMYTWEELVRIMRLIFPEATPPPPGLTEQELRPSYNVAPTQLSPILVRRDAGAGIITGAWGLVPHWSKDARPTYSTINARCESVATSPAFRGPFRSSRCIVPVSGFYEWQKVPDAPAAVPRADEPAPETPDADPGGLLAHMTAQAEGARPKGRAGAKHGARDKAPPKQPWYLTRADEQIMLLAGLYEPAREGGPGATFTIVTTGANPFIARLHDRMPVVLEPEHAAAWLDPAATAEMLTSLMKPAADGVLTAHRVSRRVNNPMVNEPGLVREDGARQ